MSAELDAARRDAEQAHADYQASVRHRIGLMDLLEAERDAAVARADIAEVIIERVRRACAMAETGAGHELGWTMLIRDILAASSTPTGGAR